MTDHPASDERPSSVSAQGQVPPESETAFPPGAGRVLAALLVGVAAFAGGVSFGRRGAGSADERFSQAELAMLPAARDVLSALGDEPALPKGRETRHRTQYQDGDRQWVSEYAEGEKDALLSLYCAVHLAPTVSQARDRYLSWRRAAETIAEGDDGGHLEDHNRWMSWGQQWRCAEIVVDEEPVGNVFVARKERRVYYFELKGRAFPDGPALAAFLLPYLDAVERVGR